MRQHIVTMKWQYVALSLEHTVLKCRFQLPFQMILQLTRFHLQWYKWMWRHLVRLCVAIKIHSFDMFTLCRCATIWWNIYDRPFHNNTVLFAIDDTFACFFLFSAHFRCVWLIWFFAFLRWLYLHLIQSIDVFCVSLRCWQCFFFPFVCCLSIFFTNIFVWNYI